MIALDKLVKRYQDRLILDGITTRFDDGERVALIGPSGGGKSTLLRCLNGLEEFHEGSLEIVGEKLLPGGNRVNAAALSRVRQKVGFVFQQWHLFAHRSTLGNVIEAPVHVKGMSVAEATERAKKLLDRVGMSHRESAYPAELSGGEQQRVAIARALAMEPKVLLLDEPTSALDPERIGDVLELLNDIAKDGLTMVMVTHDVEFARKACSRVVVLHGGKILEEGSPAEVLDAPKHERTRAFLGME